MKSVFILFVFFTFLQVFLPVSGQIMQVENSDFYFQQDVNYKINVRLDDRNHVLYGYEEIVYKNNSPAVLQEIYFHLYPNAYSNRKTAYARQEVEGGSTDFYYAKEHERGFIDSLDFKVNGVKAMHYPVNEQADVVRFSLPQPLNPGGSITITTPFRVKIPYTFSRFGHVENQYQITQWFPKPAVYDRKGWHPMPYLDQGEFYYDFGTYDVFITLPKNFVVGATGELQADADGEAEKIWLKKREERSRKMLEQPEKSNREVFQPEFASSQMKTLHFRQEKVHDFAWFCDPHYYVMTDEAALPNSSRKVKTMTLFCEKDKNVWRDGIKHLNDALYYYSLYVGEYPFNVCTAVDGALSAGGGMEYPTITVVAASGNSSALRQVIVHEVGHNWFQGVLASNERIHPWMDESINSYYERRTIHAILKRDKLYSKGFSLNTDDIFKYGFKYAEGWNNDQPIEYPSEKYTNINYGIIVYGKGTDAFEILESYLGTERFDRCMNAYFNKWKLKHPYPEDIQAVFETTSGEKMDWFFKGYLNSQEPIEFIADDTQIKGDKIEIELENRSQFPLPAFIALKDENKSIVDTMWTPPFIGEQTFLLTLKNKRPFTYVEVNAGQKIPEMNPNNNVMKWNPSEQEYDDKCATLSFRPIWRNENAFKRYIFYSPALGWNTRDGFMAGLGFYYQAFPKRKFEFHALPMYAFGSEKFTGSVGATYRIFTEGRLRKIEFRTRTALFADFLHSKNFIEFYIKPKNPRKKLTYIYSLNSYHIGTRSLEGNKFTFQNGFRPYYVSANLHYLLDKTLWRFGIDAEIGAHSTEAIRAMIAPKFIYKYTREGELHVRAFAGRFMSNAAVPVPLRFGLSGSFDPFGEHIMFDRPMFYAENPQQSTWLNRQIIEDQGFFRTITGVTSDKWMAAFNGAVSLPNTSNIRIFGNLGLVPNDTRTNLPVPGIKSIGSGGGNVNAYYDAGISLHFFQKVLNIYLPLAGSVFENGTPKSFNDFHQNITFSLKINDVIRKYIQ